MMQLAIGRLLLYTALKREGSYLPIAGKLNG